MLTPPLQQSAPCRSCWYVSNLDISIMYNVLQHDHTSHEMVNWQLSCTCMRQSRLSFPCSNARNRLEHSASKCSRDTQSYLALLQADEERAAASQSSRAAAKRARKKAAKQQASAGAQPEGAAASTAAEPPVVNPGPDEPAAASGRSITPASDDPAAEPARNLPSTASGDGSSSDEVAMLQQPAAAADHPAVQSDRWRCPLSGRVMPDPVLYGSEGYSFEREALEECLAANPGVHLLSRQLLPPGHPGASSGMLPNHALRNVVQQMQLGDS